MKNCLSIIVAAAWLCEREVSERGRDRLQRAKQASARLRELLEEDLRANDAVTSPSESPRRISICITSLVRAACERLADRAERGGVGLYVQCGGGRLLADEELLGEALFNLVSNAIEATPEGGGVHVSTSVTNEGDQHWMVKDTGRGIAADQFVELGRRFYSRREGGTGLGLALVQEAVAKHGGLLRVESELGVGTTFSVWLPSADQLFAAP